VALVHREKKFRITAEVIAAYRLALKTHGKTLAVAAANGFRDKSRE
jgi:hypothetical protein